MGKKRVNLKTLENLKKKAESAVRGGNGIKAINFYRQIIQNGRKLGGNQAENYVARAYFGLGGSALEDKDYRNAREQFTAALKIYDRQGNGRKVRSTKSRLARIASEEGKIPRKGFLKRLGVVATIFGFLGGSLFVIGGVTGNSIINVSPQTSNVLGAVLFLLGIIGLYFWMSTK